MRASVGPPPRALMFDGAAFAYTDLTDQERARLLETDEGWLLRLHRFREESDDQFNEARAQDASDSGSRGQQHELTSQRDSIMCTTEQITGSDIEQLTYWPPGSSQYSGGPESESQILREEEILAKVSGIGKAALGKK
jgi:hypothetical protein